MVRARAHLCPAGLVGTRAHQQVQLLHFTDEKTEVQRLRVICWGCLPSFSKAVAGLPSLLAQDSAEASPIRAGNTLWASPRRMRGWPRGGPGCGKEVSSERHRTSFMELGGKGWAPAQEPAPACPESILATPQIPRRGGWMPGPAAVTPRAQGLGEGWS